ncbi:MAG: VOC family protein [Chthonomonas sp.]|nr:VOC family protein [Chthonomonas sp.]
MSDRWIAAPILGVPNVRKSVEYYRDVLGFTLDPEEGIFSPDPSQPGGVYGIVSRDGVRLHFQLRRQWSPMPARSEIECDAYIMLPDVDRYYEEVSARGARIVRPPMDNPYGLRDFVIEDPNGYRIVFGSLMP